jgi:hypothetical protein
MSLLSLDTIAENLLIEWQGGRLEALSPVASSSRRFFNFHVFLRDFFGG